MRLSIIIEDEENRLRQAVDRARKLARNSSYVLLAKKPDVLSNFLIRSASNTKEMLYENRVWWDKLYGYVPELKSDTFNYVMSKTIENTREELRKLQDAQEKKRKESEEKENEVVEEGIASGLAQFIRVLAVVGMLVVSALAGARTRSGHSYNRYGSDPRSDDGKDTNRRLIQLINTTTVSDFLVRTEPYAAAILNTPKA